MKQNRHIMHNMKIVIGVQLVHVSAESKSSRFSRTQNESSGRIHHSSVGVRCLSSRRRLSIVADTIDQRRATCTYPVVDARGPSLGLTVAVDPRPAARPRTGDAAVSIGPVKPFRRVTTCGGGRRARSLSASIDTFIQSSRRLDKTRRRMEPDACDPSAASLPRERHAASNRCKSITGIQLQKHVQLRYSDAKNPEPQNIYVKVSWITTRQA